MKTVGFALAIVMLASPALGLANDWPSFQAVSTEIKRTTDVPVLLPTFVPYTDGHHLYPLALESNSSMYRVGIELAPDCREATSCRIAHISGSRATKNDRQAGRLVTLRDGIRGHYMPARCGGAGCGDGTLSFQKNGYTYTVGVKGASDATALVRMAEGLRKV